MKRLKLIHNYKGIYKKGTKFYMISESEFIGIKEYVLLTNDLKEKIKISEEELNKYFILINKKSPFKE